MKKDPSTFGLSLKRVIKLLNVGADTPEITEDMDQQKADLLSERLKDMLPLYHLPEQQLSTKHKRMDQTIAALAGEPIGKLLEDPKTDINFIRMTKDYGRKLSTRAKAKSEAEHHTANTIYYAAIAHALLHRDLKITKLSHQDLKDSFRQLSKEDWIPKNMRELFLETSKYCEAKMK